MRVQVDLMSRADFTIGELSRRTARAPSAIRYYEEIGLLPAPERVSGRRRYTEDAVRSLAVIWDIDFLYGPKTADGEDTYVLCEINVSSVFPIPDQAPAEIARLVEARFRCSH